MVCPKCGRENDDGKMICVECGCELKTIHIHSHKVKNKSEEFFALFVVVIFTVFAMIYTIKRFDLAYAYISISLILFELFNLFVSFLILRSLIVATKLNKAYIVGNVSDASKYGIEYGRLIKGYQKLLPGVVVGLFVSIGFNVLMKSGDIEGVKTIFMAVAPIAVIFIVVGLVEMIRKS